MKQVGAVIAAAGLSSRMGDFKPLLPFGKACIAHHLVEMLKQAGVSPIVMVTGYRGEELEEALKDSGILLLRNQNYTSTEMLDSVKLGFSVIRENCDAALVMPVDVPAVTGATVRKIVETQGAIVRTKCGNRRGHPVKLDAAAMDVGLSGRIRPERFFKSQRRTNPGHRGFSDKGSFLDADTKEEYIAVFLQLEGSRGQGYPDGETLRWLLEISKMPEHLRRHSEAVSRKALSMAVELQSTGRMLDLNLIRSAALLHDIGKGHPDHAAAASFLQENGYGRAAEIVQTASQTGSETQKQADETLIVYLADKMIRETGRIFR